MCVYFDTQPLSCARYFPHEEHRNNQEEHQQLMEKTLEGYLGLLSLFFGVVGCFDFLQSLHDFLLMGVQVEPLSEINLRVLVAFEGHVSSTDSIKYFHAVGFNLKYQLTLVDTFLVLLHLEVAE